MTYDVWYHAPTDEIVIASQFEYIMHDLILSEPKGNWAWIGVL